MDLTSTSIDYRPESTFTFAMIYRRRVRDIIFFFFFVFRTTSTEKKKETRRQNVSKKYDSILMVIDAGSSVRQEHNTSI